ncbi:MAG: hypothetical protein J6S36_05570 [Eggerthellaceae bacterium]|nr:hypothetical protein [Eggerthellaceae bacterium]
MGYVERLILSNGLALVCFPLVVFNNIRTNRGRMLKLSTAMMMLAIAVYAIIGCFDAVASTLSPNANPSALKSATGISMKTPSELELCDTGQSASTGDASAAGEAASAAELPDGWADDAAGAAAQPAQHANRAHTHKVRTTWRNFLWAWRSPLCR